MTFITLNRPDVFACDNNGNMTSKHQQPITINPQHIVSMVEHFDHYKEFVYTELYLSNGTYERVTSKIEEIVEEIGKV